MIQGIRFRARPRRGLTLTIRLKTSRALPADRSNCALAGTIPKQSSGLAGPYLISIHGSRLASTGGRSPSRLTRRRAGACSEVRKAASSCSAMICRRIFECGPLRRDFFAIAKRRPRPVFEGQAIKPQRNRDAAHEGESYWPIRII